MFISIKGTLFFVINVTLQEPLFTYCTKLIPDWLIKSHDYSATISNVNISLLLFSNVAICFVVYRDLASLPEIFKIGHLFVLAFILIITNFLDFGEMILDL